MQKKIFFSFLLIIVLPTLLILFAVLEISTSVIEERTISSSLQVVENIVKRMDTLLANYQKLTMQVYYNNELMNLIDDYSSFQDNSEILDNSLHEILDSFVNSDKYLMSASIRGDNFFVNRGANYIDIEDFFVNPSEHTSPVPGRLIWLPTIKLTTVFGLESYYFGAIRLIRRKNKTLGRLLLLFREDFFYDIYESIRETEQEEFFIISDQGIIVSCRDESSLGTTFLDPYSHKLLTNISGYFLTEASGKEEYVIFSTSEITGWCFVHIIPQQEILEEITQLKKSFFLLIFLYSGFIVFLSFIFSRGLIKPLDEVIRNIELIGEGKMETQLTWSKDDEIGRLAASVSSMTSKIKTLIKRVTREEAEKNKAELKALQMQLSPHFVYNTLDTIKWMAVINGQENIKEMTSALIRLMRTASDPDAFLIPLEQELALIKNYVYIQKMRYTGFSLDIRIPDSIKKKRINKFILQNIVENSITHGFRGKENGGLIIIEGEIHGEKLKITVRDNGKGFDTRILDYRRISVEDDNHAHTGLKNVHARLVLNYGTGYGVSVWSEYGKGTKTTVTIPVIEGE